MPFTWQEGCWPPSMHSVTPLVGDTNGQSLEHQHSGVKPTLEMGSVPCEEGSSEGVQRAGVA